MVSKKAKPKISIIVPVYNVEPYLEKCVESILNQNFTDFEIILVDDGSTDKSGEICDLYAKQDERVVVFHQEYKGVSAARNLAVQAVRGEFIGFVDSDDYIDPNMYSELYRLCQETNSQIAVCKLGREIDGKLINKDHNIVQLEMKNEEAMEQLFRGVLYRFSLCNKLFRSDCFNGVLFPNNRIHEDLATTYKLFSRAEKVIFKNFIGYFYVQGKDSILTSKYNHKRLDSFVAWEELLTYIKDKYPKVYMISITTYTYWCLDNLNYVFQQVENERERTSYLNYIRRNIQRYVGDIIKNKNISIYHKYEIFILAKSMYFYLIINRMKRLVVS